MNTGFSMKWNFCKVVFFSSEEPSPSKKKIQKEQIHVPNVLTNS